MPVREVSTAALAIGTLGWLALLVLFEAGVLPAAYNVASLSIVIPLLAVPAGVTAQEEEINSRTMPVTAIVLSAFVLALGVRLGLAIAHEVPLGYDAGLYKHLFDVYSASLPSVPESDLPDWIRTIYPQGLPVLVTSLATLLGVQPESLVRFGLPVLSALLVFPIYHVGAYAFGQRAGVIAAALYALSYTQLFLFGLVYLKNAVGLLLFLLALAALQRHRFLVFGLLLGGVGFYHRPTFLIAVVVTVAYAAVMRERRLVPALALAAAVMLPPLLLRTEQNLGLVFDAWSAGNSAASGATDSGGTFFDLSTYRIATLAYQPLALVGVVWAVRHRRWELPVILLVATAAWVSFEVFFFRRSVIPLDIAMLMLAGKGASLLFQRVNSPPGRLAAASAVILLVSAVSLPSVRFLRDAEPLVSADQLGAVEWIATNTPQDAVVVASAYDAPWVIGWSNRSTIAPGQFDEPAHDREEWLAFLESEDPLAAADFLSAYPRPLFIYHSGRPASYMEPGKFNGASFARVHQADGASVYAYSPEGP